MKKVTVLIGLLLFLCVLSNAYAADQVVVLNSNDWKELYLGTVYAGSIGSEVIYFNSLAEAQRKTETLPRWDTILILESDTNPVYKSYSNYLDKKKFSNYEVLEFKDYSDLQEKLFLEADYSKYVLFEPEFGVEALTFATYCLERNYAPLFVDFNNVKKISSNIDPTDELIVAGKFPSVLRQKFGEAEFEFEDYYNQNANAISVLVANELGSEWGILASPETFDLSFLTQRNPLFLYLGDVDEIANSIRETKVSKLEIGGNALADISKNIEQSSGRDLKLLVKYGQTITNLPGFEGKILDMDSIVVKFPYSRVNLGAITYYKNESILVVSIENQGNVDSLVFLNLEFGGKIYGAEYNVIIPEGESISIPFEVAPTNGEIVNIDLQYDYSDDLRFNLFSDEGLPIIQKTVSIKEKTLAVQVTIDSVEFDDAGRMLISYENPSDEDVVVRAELILKNELISSSKELLIPAHGRASVVIRTPYNTYDDFRSFETRVKTFYGVEDTLFVREDVVKVNLLTNILLYAGLVIALLLILAVVLYFVLRRKK